MSKETIYGGTALSFTKMQYKVDGLIIMATHHRYLIIGGSDFLSSKSMIKNKSLCYHAKKLLYSEQ